MSKRAEGEALKRFPEEMTRLPYQDLIDAFGGKEYVDFNSMPRGYFQLGYEQAEKDTLERAIEWWRPRLCGFLKEGLTDGVLEEFRNAIEDENKDS